MFYSTLWGCLLSFRRQVEFREQRHLQDEDRGVKLLFARYILSRILDRGRAHYTTRGYRTRYTEYNRFGRNCP